MIFKHKPTLTLRQRFAAVLLLTTGAILGCQEQASNRSAADSNTQKASLPQATLDTTDPTISPSPDTRTIVADINGDPIDQSELDKKIRFQLYDLEWQAYQLRVNALKQLVTQEFSDQADEPPTVNIQLTPPIPPLTHLPHSAVTAKGELTAPITVAVFCSFQSPHCKRMQPVYQQLQKQHPGKLRFEHFDYPLSFHRYARPAANAARCANQQGKFWEFASALYAFQDDLNDVRYRTIAQQLGIDSPEFQHCLSTLKYRNAIEYDIALGENLTLSNVPITFINGLYVKGPVPLATLNFYTQYALTQLENTTQPPVYPLVRTGLPLRLVAINLASDPQHSSVVLEHTETKEQRLFQRNQAIQFPKQTFEAPLLSQIEAQRILLTHDNRQEYLPLTHSSAVHSKEEKPSLSHTTATSQIDDERMADTEDTWEAYPDRRFNEGNRELPVTAITPLSRAWLDQQLINQTELEQHFQPAEHQVEGHALLKLNEIAQQEFYQTLGLKEGDVVLRVNDQWLHNGQNPLWDTLNQQEAVSIQLIRKGLPIRYDFAIE